MMDPDWLNAMHEELHQFERNKVWSLVERPDPAKHNIIGTKWIFRNKQDEDGIVVRNKARLLGQGYTQMEGIDFGETYALVARLESNLCYACLCKFQWYIAISNGCQKCFS